MRERGSRLSAKAHFMNLARIASGLLAIFLLGMPLHAAPNANRIASICEGAAAQAAQRYGIPVAVMQALTLTETGRKMDGRMRPWPWTVNVGGKGYWFDTRMDAIAFVETKIPKNVRSYDLGCFQINFRWHGEGFASKSDMFDPILNADYAARFLRSLLPEFRTWRRAAGAYHSRTPKFADRYERIFSQHLSAFDETAPLPHEHVADTIAEPRTNTQVVAEVQTRSLLGQSLAWDDEPKRPGSLIQFRRNPQRQGLLRQPSRALY